MRIAVIGSGAAAVGVLDRLSMLEPGPEITLIDRAECTAPQPPIENWTAEALRSAYKNLRAEYGRAFPPPKTTFGMRPNMRDVEGWGQIWDSNAYGGLTTVWGLSSVPFSARELHDWPFGRADLDPHYAAIAKHMGIAGAHDALNQWFGEDFVNRPPIATTQTIQVLEKRTNDGPQGSAYRLVAGIGRLALETRSQDAHACVACGECMIGCPRGAMYSTVAAMRAFQRAGLISRTVFGRALAVEGNPRRIVVEAAGGRREAVGPFDLVYVCAGCPGTTEFAMRSLGLRDGPEIVDNSVYTFPLLYTGPVTREANEGRGHVALANLLINAIPLNSTGRSAQIQIYPFLDHLWRYVTPQPLWPAVESLARVFRRRMMIARVFLHGEYSQRYALHVAGSERSKMTVASVGTPLARIPDLWRDISRGFRRAGFFSPIRPIRQRTSSHYAASLPLGHGPVASDASIRPRVYLCDSSVFPTAPATSPTFTIMANARRIAHASVSN